MTRKTKITLIIIASLLLVGIIALQGIFVMMPVRKIHQVQNLVHSDSSYMKKYSSYIDYPELFPEIKKIAFADAQIETAKSDSIWLLINLADKSASLRVKGVEMHKSDIVKMKVDPFFYGLDPVTYRKLFSEALIVRSDSSTVIKNPIVVKKAPKDTIEAMAQLKVPDSLTYGPAFITFNLDYGIKLVMKQTEKVDSADVEYGNIFEKNYRREKIINNLKRLYKKDVEYVPEIILELPKKEIHSIYRAIPVNAEIVLTF